MKSKFIKKLTENSELDIQALIEMKEQEYRNYIEEHKTRVKYAWDNIVKQLPSNNDEELDDPEFYNQLEENIEHHDDNKFEPQLFEAYRKHFYPVNQEEYDSNEPLFEDCSTMHQDTSPHHWEYWLNTDSGIFKDALDLRDIKMAYYEMFADWLSFNFVSPEDGQNKTQKFGDWWKENKSRIKIHPELKDWFNAKIKDILKFIKEDDSGALEEISLNEETEFEQKQILFNNIKEINPNAKWSNYENKGIPEMLNILSNYRKKAFKNKPINKSKEDLKPEVSSDYAMPDDNPELFDTTKTDIDWKDLLTKEEIKDFLSKDDKVESAENIIYADRFKDRRAKLKKSKGLTRRELVQDLTTWYSANRSILKEATISQLQTATSQQTPKMAGRADFVDTKYLGISKYGIMNFRTTSQTHDGKYWYQTVELKNMADIFDYDEDGKPQVVGIGQSWKLDDVNVHCTCPAWLYWALQYKATQRNYNDPNNPERRAPQRNNTRLAGGLCKHLQSVAELLMSGRINDQVTSDIYNFITKTGTYNRGRLLSQAKKNQNSIDWKTFTSYMNDELYTKAQFAKFLNKNDIKGSLEDEIKRMKSVDPNLTVESFLKDDLLTSVEEFSREMNVPAKFIYDYFKQFGLK